ncbi:si:ch211-226m16.3 protein isoform X4 [Danio rerio]|uniref:Si:ch211-226m16.3 protein isoform X4 n=1 Tax=Danio rerio TaxID=7955 RepID=A0AC58IJS7_DANRE
MLASVLGFFLLLFLSPSLADDTGLQKSISELTTRQTLRRMGYSSRRPHWLPLLSANNRKLRLQFAQAQQNWTIEDWETIAWSDESRFLLRHSNVAEDIGPHQLERLVELLTVRECEDLIFALSQPEESIFKHLDRLSAERNQLFPSRRRRSTNHQPPCHSALKDWLQIHGEQIYYDRLSRALQQIGRTDIAIEVGKNINQDKTLAIQRYVEGYHELVNQMASNIETHQPEDLQFTEKKAPKIGPPLLPTTRKPQNIMQF